MSSTDNREAGQGDRTVIRLADRPMAGGFIREAAVSSSQASKAPCRCPACDGGDVLIEGQFRREFSEEFVGGESQGYRLDDGDPEKNVLAVLCSVCKIRYVIEPDVMFALRENVCELSMEIGRMQGLSAIESETDKVQ